MFTKDIFYLGQL